MEQSQEDRIISAFLNSIGPWREFIVVGGGFALFIYKLYLADPKLYTSELKNRFLASSASSSFMPNWRLHML